jgi:Domain of unknown function (DUF3786)
MSNKTDALNEAIAMALEKLKEMNIPAEKTGNMRVFGKDMILDPADYSLKTTDGKAAKPADRLLLLHYLLCDLPVKATGELISFRDFTGGQFYYQPFVSRTTGPMSGRFHNDLECLKKNLDRFDWEEVKIGDFAAKIKTFGELDLTLVYHLGDDEFPPAAEVLFDSCIKRVYEAEDAAVLASRVCIGLL